MKADLLHKGRPKQGQAPGTLQMPPDAARPNLYIFAYDSDRLEEVSLDSPAQIVEFRGKWPMVWVDVDGLGDADVIAELGRIFKLHPLALEDVLHVPQRSKAEVYEDSAFIVLRMVQEHEGVPFLEQLSMFWGEGYVLTFQERPGGDVFNGVRERLRKGGKRVKMSDPDYMAYALIDSVVDGFFPVLEHFGDRLNELEEQVLSKAPQHSIKAIHRTKRDLHALRMCVWPMREAISKIASDANFMEENLRPYLRDCLDHITQILDIVENYRERLSSMTDLYMFSISNRMNEIMKVLTIISTIFMPLNFIVGIYGMNFDTSSPYNMPELTYRYGYPIVIGIMLLMVLIMVGYFKKVGWLTRAPQGEETES